MKILIQSVKNPEYMKVWDNVTAVTFRSNGDPEIHRRGGSAFVVEPNVWKLVTIT